jgi:uncharacterized protein (DUF885 family)
MAPYVKVLYWVAAALCRKWPFSSLNSPPESHPSPRGGQFDDLPMNPEFAALAEEATEKLWKHQPVAATRQGVHRYDDRFSVFNSEYLSSFAEESEDLARKLRRFKDKELSAEEVAERDLLRGRLEIAASEIRDVERHTRSADVYVSEIVAGLSLIVSRRFAPLEERAVLALERLRGVWRVLREGMANLRRGRNVPKVWTENGICAAEGALEFLEEPLGQFIESVPNEALQADLREAVATARCALDHYLNFLRLDMLASSKGRFGVGKEHYLLLLKKRQGVEMTSEELLDLGETLAAQARRRLEAHASGRGGKSWRQLADDARKRAPDADSLPRVYREAAERARDFAASRGLIDLPSGAALPEIGWIPRYLRHVLPSAHCFGLAPLDECLDSFLMLAPMEPPRATEEDRPPHSSLHCFAAIPVRVASEVIPGRHFFSLRQRGACLSGRRHDASLISFGWSARCREILLRDGFFGEPDEELMALRDGLIDALGLILDARMHCQDMSLDEAAHFLCEEAGLEAAPAERSARRHTIWPGEGASAALGSHLIEQLRAEMDARFVESKRVLAERVFHDALLDCGSLPFDALRVRMMAWESGSLNNEGASAGDGKRPASKKKSEEMIVLAPRSDAKETASAAEPTRAAASPEAEKTNGSAGGHGSAKNGNGNGSASIRKNGASSAKKVASLQAEALPEVASVSAKSSGSAVATLERASAVKTKRPASRSVAAVADDSSVSMIETEGLAATKRVVKSPSASKPKARPEKAK